MSRRTKQLAYGIGHLTVATLFFYAFYAVFFAPGPSCTNNKQDRGEEGIDCGGVCSKICLPRNLKPITVQSVQTFQPATGKLSILAKIQNPNANLAARQFDYVINLYGSNRILLSSIPGSSFLYGGDVKYLTKFLNLVDLGGMIGDPEVVIQNVDWVPADRFLRPQLTLQDRKTETRERGVQVTGRLANKDTLDFPTVTIHAIFYGQSRTRPLGFSETEIEYVRANDVRPFAINHPPLTGVDPLKTEVVVTARRP